MNINIKLAEYKFIETKRLFLRPLSINDVSDMYEYSSKKENLKFVYPPHKTKLETKLFIVNNFMAKPLGKWGIALKNTNKLIGTIDFIKLNEKDKKAEIGYVLNENFWGLGYMPEALENIVDFSFREFGIKELELVIDKRNFASCKVAEKTGFRKRNEYKSSNKYTKEIARFISYKLERWEYLKENE